MAANLLASIAGLGIGEVLKGLGVAAKDIRAAITGELSQEQKAAALARADDIDLAVLALHQKTQEMQAQVIVAEAKGESWLQRNWRPILMISIVGIVVNNYIMVPYLGVIFPENVHVLEMPEQLWTLMQIGVGGYIAGRTAEKVVESRK